MKIIVAIKQVTGRDSALKIDLTGAWIDESDVPHEINEADAYALEAALQLKERQGGEVIALSAGPERAGQALREALAKGADRAIHIETGGRQFDSLATARLLAEAARQENPDLIVAGVQSDDVGAGLTGVMMAELLGMPHATLVVKIEAHEAGLRVQRELEGGWYQYVDLPLPSLLAIQSGVGKLRYATLVGIKKARAREIRRLAPESLGVSDEAAVVVDRLHTPERAKQVEIMTGVAGEAAAKLVEKLRFEARVL